ncbi:MAG: peroxide stress protein YaaA [Prolixibacteraceae bacterium]
MLILLSPSKTLDFGSTSSIFDYSQPIFTKEVEKLTGYLSKLSLGQLKEIMKISTKLALLNQERYAFWKPDFTTANAHPSIFSFKGEVYHGLDVGTMSIDDVEVSRQHLRILSGLYGVLRPLDLIQPYRLEMGISFQFGKYENLYHFWRQKITKQIGADLKESGSDLLINLASQEYFSAIEIKKLKAHLVTPQFLEEKNGAFRMITVYTKKARGMMTRYILQNRIAREEDLRGFDLDGYYFNNDFSKPGSPVFTR